MQLRSIHRTAIGLALVLAPGVLLAQSDTSRATRDSLIERARVLTEAGNAAEARKMLDSLLRTLTPDSARYAEALYWRAALAPAAVDAERDYRRLLVEAPLTPRAEDALLQLAQLEQARGDRRAATDHLQRFMLTYPKNPARPRVAVSLVRLLMDQGMVARGCEALKTGRESIPQENLELRNQLEFYAPRCVSLDVALTDSTSSDSTRRSATDSTQREAQAASDSTRRTPTADTSKQSLAPSRPAIAPPSTATSKSFYSVQIAAYDSREAAIRMSRVLVGRGLEARVDGSMRPYRVRIGKYATRAEAVKAAATLKSQGIAGFVTLVKG